MIQGARIDRQGNPRNKQKRNSLAAASVKKRVGEAGAGMTSLTKRGVT